MTTMPGYITDKQAVLIRLRRVEHLQRCLDHDADPGERQQHLEDANRAIARLVHS